MTDVHVSCRGGCGFVCFASEEETQMALQECADLAVNGVAVSVELSTLPKPWTAPSLLADALAYNSVAQTLLDLANNVGGSAELHQKAALRWQYGKVL
eukprot:CAMPEP_0117536712 /NCGR_PEP_ID=MMETSP0784-20121206/41593_1 /TAXON_ID=39447 /ORGANISM="" /LENGTH=97 /DNA_ID=CAMNT_0005333281 /DNA_START=170 /DNA_END=464 /DNA_ORIENTATION=+